MYILFQPVFWFRLGVIDKPKKIQLVIWIKVAAIWLISGDPTKVISWIFWKKVTESAEFSNLPMKFKKKLAELADLKKGH